MKFETNGLDGLCLSMQEIADLPDSVINAMLTDQAEIVSKAQRQKAEAYGVQDSGETIRSIKAGKPKRTRGGGELTINFSGDRPNDKSGKSRKRNAEVAFVNEYGKSGQPARPFIRDATEQSADAAVDAAAKIYDEFLKSKGL